MNTMMWENEPTGFQIKSLERRGVYVVNPVEKRLACNDFGMGAMAPISDIAREVEKRLRWKFPLDSSLCRGIPLNHHPGAFGFHRRRNHHTGVDLYCDNLDSVTAVEDGVVVKIDIFTGPKVGHNWWEETWGIMIEGASGVVNYGELHEPSLKVGDRIERGWHIGRVKRVLFKDKFRTDIPGHSTSMLHLELYKHGTRDFADWHDMTKNPNLLDPTPYLIHAVDAPTNTLTWDNPEAKEVG
jgi:murein DD-endopeptidase MepM/ murein hydrolase activator NlpD